MQLESHSMVSESPAQAAAESAHVLGPRAAWRDVLAGRARLVGARTAQGRKHAPPGVVSPWEPRAAMGLHYGNAEDAEASYFADRTVSSDMGVMARYILSKALGGREGTTAKRRVSLGKVSVDALSVEEAKRAIIDALREGRAASAFFVHAHACNLAEDDAQLAADLAAATWVLPDGVGIRLGAAMLGTPLPSNVNGTDLIPELLAMLARESFGVALVGGGPGTAERAAKAWSDATGCNVVETVDGFQDRAAYRALAERLSAKGPTLVLIGLGSPLQERLAREVFSDRPGLVVVTVGGLFDFAAGNVPRAPIAWREVGAEWVWRLLQEPKRLGKRYLVGNPRFMARMVGKRLSGG